MSKPTSGKRRRPDEPTPLVDMPRVPERFSREDRAHLMALVEQHGLVKIAAAIGCGRETLTRVLAGLSVRPATRSIVALFLKTQADDVT